MRFEALHHADRLEIVNPHGDVGLLTLWSPVRTARRRLAADAPELLDPARSRVAVVANLYGDGMYAMFCNLLHNPQVRHLVAIGEDLGLPTCAEIEAFIRDGLEDAELLGAAVRRVRGTGRVLPADPRFDAERLRARLGFHRLGRLSRPGLAGALRAHLDGLPHDPGDGALERVRVELPAAPERAFRPSDPGAHQVVRRRPLDCWEELVVRTVRFGRPVELADGPRLELANAKAVIAEPAADPPAALAEHGFELERLLAYGERMLDPRLPEGIAYTYGHRLRARFVQPAGEADSLATVVELLRADPRTRRAYVALWDTAADLPGATGAAPCLTTLFFRRAGDALALTATYRAHNLLRAWLENVYGLMAVQAHVAGQLALAPGPITVVSHSLGIDPRSPRYELARALAERWRSDDDADRAAGRRTLREDPHGYFVVSVDEQRGTIVAEHRFGGVLVKRYEAERAVTIEREVAADMAVSLVSHALWLGRELTAKEQLLRARLRAREATAALAAR